MRTWRKLIRDESGATGIEYGVIVALLAVGLVTTVNTVGGRVGDVLGVLASELPAPPPGNAGNNP